MASVESVIKDIETSGVNGQEEILHYLEEVLVLGSFATEITNEVKENRFSRGKIRVRADSNSALILINKCVFNLEHKGTP